MISVGKNKNIAERFLDMGNIFFIRLNKWSEAGFPKGANPFAQSGAIANTTFIIAVISGILLLFWYKPSVHQAFASVEGMAALPWTAELMRSLHRYSSDGCMFFIVVHALHTFFANRFSGARWLAWTTGVAAVTLLWAVGWTGYWLVWDERAQLVAVGTAKALDLVPIFADPLSRSFLTDSGIHSLFFFVIFFAHMLVPLAIGVALWIHIIRLHRPKFITDVPATIWITVSLILLSLLAPATTAEPAQMLHSPQGFTMDWWYLAPIWVVDRLSGGFFWAFFLVSGLVLYSLPFWRIPKKRLAAEVVESRCNACRQCFHDCPFNAIKMIPRTDGKKYKGRSWVDPSKCVSCGICAGSCDSAGIGLPEFPVLRVRKELEAATKATVARGPGDYVAFVCQEAVNLHLAEEATSPYLPGFRIQEVPCIGWLHPLTVERLLKRGTPGVLLAACESGYCKHREGPKWTRLRFAGERKPFFRADQVDPDKVKIIEIKSGAGKELSRAAAAFRHGEEPAKKRTGKLIYLSAVAATLLILALTWLPSDLFYRTAAPPDPQLVVSFKHAGQVKESKKELTPEELAKLPVHMRKAQVTERTRADVRLRVFVDGVEVLSKSFEPGGLMKDMNSVGVEKIAMIPGDHLIAVDLGDSPDPDEWRFHTEKTVTFHNYTNHVLLFSQVDGFTWHLPQGKTGSEKAGL